MNLKSLELVDQLRAVLQVCYSTSYPFVLLTELLDMPLKSITTAWESGELLSCNFTLPEVRLLQNLGSI